MKLMYGVCLINVSYLQLAQEHRGLMSISYPMEHGVVKDWNDMEYIWQYIYSKEQLQTSSGEVLIAHEHVLLQSIDLSAYLRTGSLRPRYRHCYIKLVDFYVLFLV